VLSFDAVPVSCCAYATQTTWLVYVDRAQTLQVMSRPTTTHTSPFLEPALACSHVSPLYTLIPRPSPTYCLHIRAYRLRGGSTTISRRITSFSTGANSAAREQARKECRVSQRITSVLPRIPAYSMRIRAYQCVSSVYPSVFLAYPCTSPLCEDTITNRLQYN
jgi:hypothetical protein